MSIGIPKGKREQIDKSNSFMFGSIAIASFIAVFSLVGIKSLWGIRSHQSEVISKKEAAVKKLEENKESVAKLKVSYLTFISAPDNIIKGSPTGSGDRDGDNSRIILDALPSKYDFPAFITGINKLFNSKGITLDSLTGSDDELGQKDSTSEEPVEIPFTISGKAGSFDQAKEFSKTLEQSIRPIKVSKITLSGGKDSQLSIDITAASYYQPAKGVTIKKETIKR